MSTNSPKTPPANLKEFNSLLQIMEMLAGPDGCPWDREQTHQTLVPYLIEEAHEVIEAIESGNKEDLYEELGDLLLQIVFHAELGKQKGEFNISDVIFSINDKMVRRHPHVFASAQANTADDVKKNWDQIKAEEKSGKNGAGAEAKDPTKESLGGPLGTPALQRSHKIGEKTKRNSFDWPDTLSVLGKLEEEINELHESIEGKNQDEIEHEIGDVLFTVAQVARHLKIDPETSLRKANRRFEQRYFKMLELAHSRKLNWEKLSAGEKEKLWQEIKTEG